MQSAERHFILPFIFLIAIICYDNISLHQKSSQTRFTSTKDIVDKIITDNTDQLLDPSFTSLLSKTTLDYDELNKIKVITKRLSDNQIQAQLLNNQQRIFWTSQLDSTNICRDIDKGPLRGKICYAPFDKQGYVSNSTLESQGFKNYFKKNNHKGPHDINGTYITLGKTFRSSLLDKFILLGYFLGFLFITGLSIKHSNFWPILILACLRTLAVIKEWTKRFGDTELVQSFSDSLCYNSLDLLLDSILLFGGLLFITRKFVKSFHGRMTNWGMAGLSFVHMLIFLTHIRIVQILVRSENTTLSIEDLGSTSIADLFVFFSIVLLQLGIFYFGYALFRNYKTGDFSKVELYSTYAVSIIAAVVMSYFLKLDLNPGLLVLFLFCYILLMDLFVDFKSVTITWVIWWGIFYAIYLSVLFFNYDIKKEIKQRQAFLEEVHHNIPTERITALHNEGVSANVVSLVNNLLTLPDGINYDRGDIEAYIAEQLQRTDVQLELFDQKGMSLFDDTPSESVARRKLLEIDSLTSFDEIYNTIWFKHKIADHKKLYVGIRDGASKKSFPFAFNYIRDKKYIIKQQNTRKSELAQLSKADSDVVYIGSDAYSIYKPSSSRILFSKKSFLGFVKPIALFSLLFSLIILLVISFGVLNYLTKFLPEDWPLFVRNMESLNSKIQLSLIMVILLSFVIIASITSTFLKDYLTKEKDLVVREKIDNLTQELESRAAITTSPTETVQVISNYRKNIEEIHNIDLSIFALSNKAAFDYFTWTYFLKQAEPLAYTTKTGDDDSKSYLPIFSGDKIAGVATLKMRSEIQSSQLNVFDFLGSIFNVYVFLFLIASVISIFIARSITRPLSMLNQNLTQVKLGKQNKQLDWDRDDEIGILIGNYNKMVNKLEESAEIMAKNERDSAWREMAKQVAHEIKNPLTPMKLSIQYLEKAIKQQPENAIKIAKKISGTMLEQIDNLTGIAEAFGNFAELPQTSNVKVELNNIVEVVHNLFRKREDMDIKLAVPIDPIYVYADKSQLVRILNNLVKNATESIPINRRGIINLNLYIKKEKAVIQVTDNGSGIPEEMKGKIFQPKFTTKDSGSGLGLAIAANMVESMNGKIYFESVPEESTSFYIELDIIRQAIAADNKERITLD